jgi:hypothetical protein
MNKLTFNIPRFKWPVSLSDPDLNARIRAAGTCFTKKNYILGK